MASLNSCMQFRKALLKLCNILTERYAKHLNKFQKKSIILDGEHSVMVRNNVSAENSSEKDSDGQQQSQEINPEDQWDNFNNNDIKMALDEVLRHKRTAKLDAHRDICSLPDKLSHGHVDREYNV
ncbi:hypothetical protein POM88_017986 [Heracleum sosnowskyi]|uniref:Uncharacterized protein n=1 Tax=Heracleum sosnowskyi TaxID=360622 RepID=A0AAD8MZY7_9APIA|nr:hypothetical protein POM88_017986 [Heracleum sosnowskyi]